MSSNTEQNIEHWDVIVIGSGPAGQKAAVQAAKGDQHVCVIEREVGVGGSCVHRGTIPSKTLRETALHIGEMRNRIGQHVKFEIPPDLQLASLMDRMESVVNAHVDYQGRQMVRNGIDHIHGRARFVDETTITVESIRGEVRTLTAPIIVIATGSRPREPENVPIDHEHVYDSDSILSMAFLPKSLTVLGGGVIASEYATIFASLGVAVTIIDRAARPLGFLDEEILDRFVSSFEARPGCTFLGSAAIKSVVWDGVSEVVTTLENGWEVRSEKLLCALGRVANIEGLNIEAAGLKTNARGQIEVDGDCCTSTPGIYAVGDVIGPPSLASSSMEQGRRAMRSALSMRADSDHDLLPSGVYTIPEIAMVGLAERDFKESGRAVLVGRAKFSELARGQISGSQDGLLKMFADADTLEILGCQIIGEGATELVHLAQVAMINGNNVHLFVDNIFNFPTLAEAYRVAGLDIVEQSVALARNAPVKA
ncbi:MAG: NAD(P) transhydrogenase [Planctomycetota bacterium]|jgi:NAD(P) transhydrogenase